MIFFSGHIVLFKENYSEKYMGRGKKMSKVLFLNIPSHGHIYQNFIYQRTLLYKIMYHNQKCLNMWKEQ